MAFFSSWSRIARQWLSPKKRSNTPRLPRLWLEQLGERTLLSGIASAPNLVVTFDRLSKAILLSPTEMPVAIQTIDIARHISHQPTADPHEINLLGNDLIRLGNDLSNNLSRLLAGNAPEDIFFRADVLPQLQDFLTDATSERVTILTSGIDYGRLDGVLRRFVITEDELIHLRSYVSVYDDQRSEIDGSDQNDDSVSTQNENRWSEAANAGIGLPEKNDGSAIAHALATAFQEDPANAEWPNETPAGQNERNLLVNYDADLSPPQTELLPLEDGNRALVAALVAGVPVDYSTTAFQPTENQDETLLGSPVTIDGSSSEADILPESADPGPAVKMALEQRTVCSPTALHLPDSAFRLLSDDEGSEAEKATWSTIHLVDIIFATGVFQFAWSAVGSSTYGDKPKRMAKPPRSGMVSPRSGMVS